MSEAVLENRCKRELVPVESCGGVAGVLRLICGRASSVPATLGSTTSPSFPTCTIIRPNYPLPHTYYKGSCFAYISLAEAILHFKSNTKACSKIFCRICKDRQVSHESVRLDGPVAQYIYVPKCNYLLMLVAIYLFNPDVSNAMKANRE